MFIGYDDGLDYRQRPFNVPEYTKLIYPEVKPTRKFKIGVLQEGVELCEQNVKDVFGKAVGLLKDHKYLDIKHVSMPSHTNSRKLCVPLLTMGSVGCMLDGCGHGTGTSGMWS